MVTITHGDVVLCDLNPVIGTEQVGVRPVVVLQIDLAREMRNAKCETRNAKCEMRNAKCEMRNAKCEMPNFKKQYPPH